MTAIATFRSALDADLDHPDSSGKRSVQVIAVAIDEGTGEVERLRFVIVDHDGRGRLVPATQITFTDDAVTPPKYG
jgi:hypothetical protein